MKMAEQDSWWLTYKGMSIYYIGRDNEDMKYLRKS